ncbi:hypothetical protein MKJ04_05595 [Pontibacter sp. E15-1]|uniref:glycoside hydrolase family 30 beta sandwich domain-containing protein n=1 Tax=Pontibacter sp. E15-1 TaxID=2919918 RepID=UPI001F50229D|nr:glycoside hydrolase family 30 beta sandwich domain-containing protein [Pontibacter sp. E15-1]MCJ8164309.1 hypothetical protein [Pontibacter sp. E15-1]
MDADQHIMVSAYADDSGKTVVVAINYQAQEQQLKLKGIGTAKTYRSYSTTATPDDNLKAQPVQKIKDDSVSLPPRSITTLVIDGTN